MPDTDWGSLISSAINAGTAIYAGQVQKQAQKRANRAAATFRPTNDFPQLGMGLASTGPTRAMGQFVADAGYTPQVVPTSGLSIGGPYGLNIWDDGSKTMAGAMVPRGPQYALGTTPSGRQQLVAIRSIGQPLLWSGDLAAVRRVARVARKLGRFIHHRRPR